MTEYSLYVSLDPGARDYDALEEVIPEDLFDASVFGSVDGEFFLDVDIDASSREEAELEVIHQLNKVGIVVPGVEELEFEG